MGKHEYWIPGSIRSSVEVAFLWIESPSQRVLCGAYPGSAVKAVGDLSKDFQMGLKAD